MGHHPHAESLWEGQCEQQQKIKKPLQPKEAYIILQRRDKMKMTFHTKHNHVNYMKGTSRKTIF